MPSPSIPASSPLSRLFAVVLLCCLVVAGKSLAAAGDRPGDRNWDRGANLGEALIDFAELQHDRGAAGVADAVRDCYAAIDQVRGFTAEVEYCVALDLGLTYWWEGYQQYTFQSFGRKTPMPEFSEGDTVMARILERLEKAGLSPEEAWRQSLEISGVVKVGVHHAVVLRAQRGQ